MVKTIGEATEIIISQTFREKTKNLQKYSLNDKKKTLSIVRKTQKSVPVILIKYFRFN